MIEKVWKPGKGRYEGIRDASCQKLIHSSAGPGSFELWKSVWENAQIEELKLVAIHGIGCKEGDAARDYLFQAVTSPDISTKAKLAGVNGLGLAKPAHTRGLVSDILGTPHVEDEVVARSVGALWGLDDPQIRDQLIAIARDRTRGPKTRSSALEVCKRDPQAGDVPVIVEALRSSDSEELQVSLIHILWDYPFEDFRTVLRELTRTAAGPEATKLAIRTLVREGNVDDLAFVQQFSEDESIPKERRREAKGALQSKAWDDKRRKNRPPR